jgi:PHD/YefM family antitoxin component YafN of YafNO toxin-antitoxin module
MRGGQIYEFYVIPLIPLLALNISLLMHHFSQITKTYLLSLLLFVSVLSYFFISGTYPFTSLATLPQIKSLKALLALPDNSVIIANNYPYLDVFLQGKNVIHWYQKIESDQTIQSSTGPITHILTDVQFVNELSADQLPFIKTQLERDSTKMEFGPLLAPGENVKPFSTENLTLYALSEAQDSLHYVLNLEGVTIDHLTQLSNNPPPAILITKSSFGSTSELESYLRELKALSNPSPKILVVQDDTGENTIPWITTPARSFYKSPEEAASSALKKTEALKNLGFSGAVITSTDNQDGYLSSIVQASSTNLIPILRYSAEIPALKTAILVTSKNDLETLTNSNYPGQIYYLVSLEEYRQISN